MGKKKTGSRGTRKGNEATQMGGGQFLSGMGDQGAIIKNRYYEVCEKKGCWPSSKMRATEGWGGDENKRAYIETLWVG